MEFYSKLASAYTKEADFQPDWQTITEFRQEIERNFATIPVPVTFVDYEPYETLEEMTADIEGGTFKVKATYWTSPVCPGDTYHKLRAVHDYFDHYEHQFPFGMPGEFASFATLAARFSVKFWPLLYSEIILNNALFTVTGERSDKVTNHFGPLV